MTIPETPQQNGVAKRRNRTLLDMVRLMMAQENLLISYWGDALLIVAYVLNRVPSKNVASTLYELWNNWKPNLTILQSWGSAAYIQNSSHKYGKLGHRGRKCIFIRYSEHCKGYVFIGEHEDETVTELESWDVTFLEDDFPRTGQIDRDLHLYEMMDRDIRSTFKQQLMLEPSGSELAPIAITAKESMLRKKKFDNSFLDDDLRLKGKFT